MIICLLKRVLVLSSFIYKFAIKMYPLITDKKAKTFYNIPVIVKPKATCLVTRQASINVRASVWHPI